MFTFGVNNRGGISNEELTKTNLKNRFKHFKFLILHESEASP